MDGAPQSESRLLQLDEPLIIAVLSCCADDPRSLFSAARAHSTLHKAAVQAVSSIRAVVHQQQQVDSVLLYLGNHGQHIGSFDLERFDGARSVLKLCHLPHQQLQGLSSLRVRGMSVQLQPGSGSQGLLGAGVPLKQLQLHDCKLLNKGKGLAAAMALLPDLQHFSLGVAHPATTRAVQWHLPTECLQHLKQMKQLTYLELTAAWPEDPEDMQHLQKLTRLQELRLTAHKCASSSVIKASMLSGLQQLTRLKLRGICEGIIFNEDGFEPETLADMTQLQHLELVECRITGSTSELLSHLQPLQELTHLDLLWSLLDCPALPSAAACAALTSSSKLQHLNISGCYLPEGVWQHIFPAGRQLPHMRELDVSEVQYPDLATLYEFSAPAPEGGLLVSCCPGLQSFDMQHLQYKAELLAPLTGLSSLQELKLRPGNSPEGLEVVCQLTQLQRLYLWDLNRGAKAMLQLPELQQLTQLTKLRQLEAAGRNKTPATSVNLTCEGPEDEPVWKQLLSVHKKKKKGA